MFRAQVCAVLGCGLMLFAASAEARELVLAVDSRIGGDSNVFRESSDRNQDGFFEFSPILRLRETNRNLNYDVSYRPTYETFFKSSDVDGFDHTANGDVTWRPTPVDSLQLHTGYSNVRRVRIEDRTGPLDPLPVFEESARERIRRLSLRLAYNRAISEVLSVYGTASFGDTDYSRSSSVDTRGYAAQAGAQYVLTPLTSVGMSGSFRLQESREGAAFQPDQDTQIWNVSFSLRRTLTPTLNASITAGPSFIKTKQKPQAPGIPNLTSTSSSYFAEFSLKKSLRRSGYYASYTRSESPGGSTSSASILDNVTVGGHYKPGSRWMLRLSTAWIRRKEIEAVASGNREETTQYTVFASALRKITDQLSVIAQYRFYILDQNQNSGSGSIGPVHTGFVSLRYTFDPVVF